jgi:hypothetical protein
VEAVFLIIALALVLMVFAPVAPSDRSRIPLRIRLARQLHLWDRYVYHDPHIWYPRD